MTKLHDTPEFRAMWAAGFSTQRIAGDLGVTPGAIWNAAKRFGYPERTDHKPKPWTAKDDLLLRKAAAGEIERMDLPELLGRSMQRVDARRRALGLVRPRKVKPNVGVEMRAGKAAASPPDLSLAGRLRDTKGSYAALAKIAAQEGWTQTQAVQRYHRARAGEAVEV